MNIEMFSVGVFLFVIVGILVVAFLISLLLKGKIRDAYRRSYYLPCHAQPWLFRMYDKVFGTGLLV